MILVTASKASMCTKAEVDWTSVESDHAGVQIWLDIHGGRGATLQE